MLRSLFLVGATAFWLTMMSLLIRREFFELAPVEASYEVLPLSSLSLRQEYRAVYLGNERIGFGFTALEKKESHESGEDAYELRHQTYLSFLFLGNEREMLVKGKADLDPQLNLKGFDVKVSSGDYWTKLTGQIAKDHLNLVIEGKEGQAVRKIIPVKGPILFSEALSLIWTPENLKIGKQGRIQVWNPLMMDFEDLNFHVIRREKISYEGADTEVYCIVIEKGGIETRGWVTPEGVMLREESPMGVVMQKEEAWKIFDGMRTQRGSLPDLPNLFSVPSNQIIQNPLALSSLKLRVQKPDGEKILEIRRDNFDDLRIVTWPIAVNEAEFAPHLESTEFIQAKDPIILQKAREITGEDKTALLASLKIMRWVHRTVEPVPTVSLPSAVQVLAIKKGDCNEYTALFTALTRSLGIPTKMVAGLIYQDGRFFYHAWAQVYVGRWVGMDPTFDQAPMDVTHIPLVEGDLQSQMELAQQIGRIKVLILETK